MNARLAARLTGWKIDIQSDTEFAQAEADAAFGGEGEDEEFSGRCGAILSNGKRCPNAALPGSRYCGVPAHQELALHDSSDEEPVVEESEPELEARADELPPDAEAVGPSLPQEQVDELESEAPADAAATHGPAATAVAEAEGDVDLDVTHPEHAPPAEVPAGIPVEASAVDGDAGDDTSPVDVSGGAGLEETLDGHDTTVGDVLYTGAESGDGDDEGSSAA
jgi:N utilization substance protein A